MRTFTAILTATLFALPAVLGAKQCVTQGKGSCQFVMLSNLGPETNVVYYVYIYDHECNQIGYKAGVDPGIAIDSELAYTVDIINRGGLGTDTYAAFAYAGGDYGKGYTSYVQGSCSSGLDDCGWMRSAFPCPAH